MTSVNEPKYKYQIKLDINQDANNWYITCNNNNISNGVEWSNKIPGNVYQKIHGKSKQEAYDFLIPFLKQKYIKEKQEISAFKELINNEYQQKFEKACQKMVDLIGKPLYRCSFTTFLTTIPRASYEFESGYTWVPIGWLDPIRMFMHELIHFQFINFWANNEDSLASKLDKKQFEYLKESLTVILDEGLQSKLVDKDKKDRLIKRLTALLCQSAL